MHKRILGVVKMISEDEIRKDYEGTSKTMALFEEEKRLKIYGGDTNYYNGSINWLQGWRACEKWILEIKDVVRCECCGAEKK